MSEFYFILIDFFIFMIFFHPCMQNTEEIIAKYAIDDNLFRLGSINPKKKIQPLVFLCLFWAVVPGAYCRGAFKQGPRSISMHVCISCVKLSK